MKKTLLIYSLLSGRSHPQKKINKINKALKNEYIINSFMCSDDIQLFSLVGNAKKDGYAFIIFLGGDGSFHHLINALMKINKEERLPILLVNNGTLNDFAHGIGIRNIKSSIKALRQNKIKELNKPEELDLLESSYITTFDRFDLSIVKKYHYILNIYHTF